MKFVVGPTRPGPLCALLLFSAFALNSCSVHGASREYEIKAVLLFNLVRFVDWPPGAFSGPDSPIFIGIMGRDPFGRALDEAVAGEEVNGRKVVVRRCTGLVEAKGCHILFISQNEGDRASRIISALRGWPILTVSELPGFTQRDGGITRFYVNEQKRIRLRINLEAARAAGLSISSKLLQLADVEKTSAIGSEPEWKICRSEAGYAKVSAGYGEKSREAGAARLFCVLTR